jgi:hypothetical protein
MNSKGKENYIPFNFRLHPELHKDFSDKCKEIKSTMADELIKLVEGFVNKKARN